MDDGTVKRLSGTVTNSQTLLVPASFKALDAVYALFVYEPNADTALKAYLATDGLAADSARHVFCLYERASKPRASGTTAQG